MEVPASRTIIYSQHRCKMLGSGGLITGADLNHAYEGWHFTSGDRRRLGSAEHNLRDFAGKWDRGRFDKGELDEAIASIQHVLDKNHLPQRDRAALDSDVGQLRAMREAYDRHEIGYGRPDYGRP